MASSLVWVPQRAALVWFCMLQKKKGMYLRLLQISIRSWRHGSEVILSSLTEDLSISDTLASMEGDVVFAALDLLDKSSIIGRKKGERIEVWRYQRFDGFGHMIAESTESTPVAIDWYDDFSSFSSLLWEGLDGYNELIVDVEGGVRRFKK